MQSAGRRPPVRTREYPLRTVLRTHPHDFVGDQLERFVPLHLDEFIPPSQRAVRTGAVL